MGFRWDILAGYGPLFAQGLWMTVQLTAISTGAGMVLGAPQYSLSGELVVPLLNVLPNATVNGKPAVPAVLGNVGRIDLIPKLPAL